MYGQWNKIRIEQETQSIADPGVSGNSDQVDIFHKQYQYKGDNRSYYKSLIFSKDVIHNLK